MLRTNIIDPCKIQVRNPLMEGTMILRACSFMISKSLFSKTHPKYCWWFRNLASTTCYTWNPRKKWEILYIKPPVIHETHWNAMKNGRFSTSKHLLYMKPIENGRFSISNHLLYMKPIEKWKILYIKPPVIHETHWKMGDSLHQTTCYTWNPLKHYEKWEILYIKPPVIHETHWKIGDSLHQTTCYTWNPLKNGMFSIKPPVIHETHWKMGDSLYQTTCYTWNPLKNGIFSTSNHLLYMKPIEKWEILQSSTGFCAIPPSTHPRLRLHQKPAVPEWWWSSDIWWYM